MAGSRMQRLFQPAWFHRGTLYHADLQHRHAKHGALIKNVFTCPGSVTSSLTIQQKGLENTTVRELLMTKGGEKSGSWLWCRTDDTVDQAVKHMARQNVGALVVLKPGEHNKIAGIVTERDNLKKVVTNERSPKHRRICEIMTEEKSLITMTSDTNILKAMQLMTENHIRHVPVIDAKIVGMVSIVDVVRAVVDQQRGEVNRLHGYIKGDYY